MDTIGQSTHKALVGQGRHFVRSADSLDPVGTPADFVPPINPLLERDDINARFSAMLRFGTADGSAKRRAGLKPIWYQDPEHEAAIFSHLARWKRGETKDPDSGSHPLVHLAWRALAIAATETGNHP